MNHIRTYTVIPSLPGPLARLRELTYNLWWSWNPDATEVFRRLDPDLWDELNHNPVQFLSQLDQKRLEQAASDAAYTAHLDRGMANLRIYMTGRTWFEEKFPDLKCAPIPSFPMEFGLHESRRIYSA